MTVEQQARNALAAKLRLQIGDDLMDPDFSQYSKNWISNLIPGIAPESFVADLSGGAGGELDDKRGIPAKFRAAFSSSALAVNTFAGWKGREFALHIGDHMGFSSIRFEAKCPNGLSGATPPHLDVLLESAGAVVAVECKCLEYLRPHVAKFSPRYETLRGRCYESGWWDAYELVKREPAHFRHLDAAQLVKHFLGLKNTYRSANVELLYLYWEPVNADSLPVFQAHRSEVNRFTEIVSTGTMKFTATSVLELWKSWLESGADEVVRSQLANLTARYAVVL